MNVAIFVFFLLCLFVLFALVATTGEAQGGEAAREKAERQKRETELEAYRSVSRQLNDLECAKSFLDTKPEERARRFPTIMDQWGRPLVGDIQVWLETAHDTVMRDKYRHDPGRMDRSGLYPAVNELIEIQSSDGILHPAANEGKRGPSSATYNNNKHRRAREIGWELHQQGGIELMREVAERVIGDFAASDRRDVTVALEVCWNDVGDWKM